MYACTYVCIYAYMYACMYACMHEYMYACIHAYTLLTKLKHCSNAILFTYPGDSTQLFTVNLTFHTRAINISQNSETYISLKQYLESPTPLKNIKHTSHTFYETFRHS